MRRGSIPNCSTSHHLKPLPFFPVNQINAGLRTFLSLRKFRRPRMFSQFRHLVGWLALGAIGLTAVAQTNDDTIRVTVTINPDGSKTVYQTDSANHQTLAATTGADGKQRGKLSTNWMLPGATKADRSSGQRAIFASRPATTTTPRATWRRKRKCQKTTPCGARSFTVTMRRDISPVTQFTMARAG